MTAEDERYYRDIYDHLIRICDLVDSYRDLLSSAMDVYLSSVSNRLNVVMKQLAVIATVFLPSASWSASSARTSDRWSATSPVPGRFGLLGIGSELAVLLGFLYLFKRRGWFCLRSDADYRDRSGWVLRRVLRRLGEFTHRPAEAGDHQRRQWVSPPQAEHGVCSQSHQQRHRNRDRRVEQHDSDPSGAVRVLRKIVGRLLADSNAPSCRDDSRSACLAP